MSPSVGEYQPDLSRIVVVIKDSEQHREILMKGVTGVICRWQKGLGNTWENLPLAGLE